MSVVGSISIRDNATAVLKNIRKEQAALRTDAAKTKSGLKEIWDKTYTAKVDTASSMAKTDGLLGKMRQLGRKAASPVIKAKDEASAKITKVSNAVKTVGKKIVSPVIRAKDEASAKITKISNAVRTVGKKIASPVIRAKDTASKVLGTIGSKLKSVGSMVVRPIIAIKDGATAGLSSIKNMLGGMAKGVTIAVGIAGAGFAAIAGGALNNGADLQQSIGGVETLFKDNSGVVKANADKAFQTAGLSANAYMETVTGFSASLLQSLGGDTTKAADLADMAIIDMADNANKMGTSMESIQNAYSGFAKQNYTMLDNLKLGYGGTKEEMQRLLRDAQKISGVKYDINSLADVYEAIHVIQESLDITGTTAKEASETFSGSFAAMKSAVSNLMGNLAIGGDVKASMEQVVDSASTFLFKNALPMIGNVIKALPGAVSSGIKKAAPKIRKEAPVIIKSLKDGLMEAFPSLAPIIGKGFDTATAAFPKFISGARNVASVIGTFAGGFAPMIPQLTAFASSMVSTIQTVAAACLPALMSVISSVQTMLPVILPVIETVVTTIGNIIAQAAPVIAGLVSGIGTVVSELAPVFSTIFSEIGDKVGSVIGFVGERMGFIQEVIGAAAPVIGDIISTAWSVISPVMDLVINVFKVLFGVVEKVFPGIQSIVETVWGVVKPIVEGIGKAVSKIAGWFGNVADAIKGGGNADTEVGKNAQGSNNWKGGLTWVGEKGAELVDLPKGSRILPHKESAAMMAGSMPGKNGIVKRTVAMANMNQSVASGEKPEKPDIKGITDILKEILDKIREDKDKKPDPDAPEKHRPFGGGAQVIIQKLADRIEVRKEEDIDEVADQVAKKVLEVVVNMG